MISRDWINFWNYIYLLRFSIYIMPEQQRKAPNEHVVQMRRDTFEMGAGVSRLSTCVLAPGDVAVAQVRVANALEGVDIPEYLGLAGCVCTALLHFIASCNRSNQQHTRERAHTFLLNVIQLSLFVSPHREHQPWAGHRSPRSSQRSTGCSCRAAPSRSHCQQLCTRPPCQSHGTHSVSAVEKTDWRHLLGCILLRKTEQEQLGGTATGKASTEYRIHDLCFNGSVLLLIHYLLW